MFEPPPETKWNVLSLGAGVQSTCLALMAERGEISGPKIDFAVFADTQAEPSEVYNHLEWLRGQVSYPIYTVTKGSLTEEQLKVRTYTDKAKRKTGDSYIKAIIPLFGKMPDGEVVGAIGRKCTADFKVSPIHKFLRTMCGVEHGQKEISVTQWIGISWDEAQRMKESRVNWAQHRWPLIEKKMLRSACIKWMVDNGYPEPPRSACYYCPFHSDNEWRRLRDQDPEHFKKAIEFDYTLREKYRKHDQHTKMEVFLHRSCQPLAEIDFDNDEDKGQMTWDFRAECEGMCGI